jgi:hypothetical protein
VFQLIKRTIETHIGVHLLIPFFVTLVIWTTSEALAIRWSCQAWSFAQILDKWPTLVWELISIYLAFLIVIGLSIKNASDVRWAAVGHLRDILPNATRYFAIGTIPLREWFEPNSLVYLATILEHRMNSRQASVPNQFLHERVLLFYTEADLQALQASFLDEHYAKSFAAIHERFQIPLAYLGPDKVREIITGLTEEHRIALGCYQPQRWKWRNRAPKLRVKPELLPFAWLEQNGGHAQALQFLKNGKTLFLRPVDTDTKKAACQKLVKDIEEMIYDSTRQLKKEFKFSNFLLP